MLCEINPFCNQILNRHWPDTLKMTDINSIEVSQIPDAEVWCGGLGKYTYRFTEFSIKN